jgi:hypothetical protein
MGKRTHLWLTCGTDLVEHAVTDESHIAAIAGGTGMFDAVCGEHFPVAAMIEPPGRRCTSCRQILTRLQMSGKRRSHRRSAA